MADVSTIVLPNGDTYILKDAEARNIVANLELDSDYDSSDHEVTLFFNTQSE